jgi:hypothetical protein
MRSYQVREKDTLWSIAHDLYYVYDDQGDIDRERVATVLRELLKCNWSCASLFGVDSSTDLSLAGIKKLGDKPFDKPFQGTPHSTRLDLPDIPGIARYGNQGFFPRARPWLFLFVWLAGIAFGGLFPFAKQYLRAGLAPQDLLSWLGSQVLNVIAAPWQAFDAILPWVCIWSLGMWMAWLAFKPAVSSPIRHARLRFLLGWIFGLFVLIPSFGRLIDILVPRAAPLLAQYTDLFPLLIIWSALVFLLYLYVTDGSAMHAEYLVPHRAIWTILTLMLMGTILAGYAGYQQVRDRINGELSALTLADTTLRQLHTSAHAVVDDVSDVLQAHQTLDQGQLQLYLTAKWPQLQRHAISDASQARDAQRYVRDAIGYYRGDKSLTADSSTGGAQGPNLDAEYIQEQIRALEQISTVLTATIQATSVLTPALAQIELKHDGTGQLDPLTSEQQAMLNTHLSRLALDAALKGDVAAASIAGIAFDGLPIFLWNGILFSVLILFPWLLLLMFLYRKRSNLAFQIYQDLDRLDRSHGLLQRVLGGSNTPREQAKVEQIVQSTVYPTADGNAAAPAGQSAGLPSAALSSGAQPADSQQKDAVVGTVPDDDTPATSEVGEIVDLLAKRTFSEFEYLISLIFLTLLLTVGWYYIFYPRTSIGLTNLIERGSGVRQQIGLITDNLTPLTIGFAGAYFFLMQMLVRRYLSNDLYPTAFLQATLRLLIVYILSLALTILPLPFDGVGNSFDKNISLPDVVALIAAFLAGIFPTSGLQMIITTFNRWNHRIVFPPTLVPEPLTKLPGVTIWIEARLFEENIESIQAMATAPIEQLIVATHFPAAQIVDWIDQSILYLHAGHDGEWFPQLRAVGIRGASDLLDAAGLNLLDPYASLHATNWEFEPKIGELERLVIAITAANASGVPRLGANDPRGIAAGAVAQLLREADTAAHQAAQASELILRIDPAAQGTYDYAQMVGTDLAQAKTSLENGSVAITDLEQAIGALEAPDLKNKLIVALSSLKEDLSKATTLMTGMQSQTQDWALANITSNQLDLLKQQLSDWPAISANLLKTLADIDAAGTTVKVADLRASLKKANDLALTVDKRVQTFDTSQLQTLDARKELMQYTKQLITSRQIIADAFTSVRSAIESDEISKTPAQVQIITSALEGSEPALKTLEQATKDADNYARGLQPESIMAAVRPKVDQASAARVGQAFEAARDRSQSLSNATTAITQPPQLTPEILYEMCDAIWPDPNITYVLNFYQRTINNFTARLFPDVAVDSLPTF